MIMNGCMLQAKFNPWKSSPGCKGRKRNYIKKKSLLHQSFSPVKLGVIVASKTVGLPRNLSAKKPQKVSVENLKVGKEYFFLIFNWGWENVLPLSLKPFNKPGNFWNTDFLLFVNDLIYIFFDLSQWPSSYLRKRAFLLTLLFSILISSLSRDVSRKRDANLIIYCTLLFW